MVLTLANGIILIYALFLYDNMFWYFLYHQRDTCWLEKNNGLKVGTVNNKSPSAHPPLPQLNLPPSDSECSGCSATRFYHRMDLGPLSCHLTFWWCNLRSATYFITAARIRKNFKMESSTSLFAFSTCSPPYLYLLFWCKSWGSWVSSRKAVA